MMEPLFSRLKAATADEHRRIESVVTVMRAEADLGDYTAYLRGLHGFYAPVEKKLNAHALLHQRKKTPLLAADLRALGAELGDECETLPALHSEAHALGCLYVLEGASLGGQVVYRHLSAKWPEVLRTSGSYLRGYGAETGAMWTAFRAELVARCDDEAALIAGAQETFSTLRRWLSC